MKKDIIVIRFGRPAIIRGDISFINMLLNNSNNPGKHDAIGGPFSFGNIIVLHTEFSPAELRTMLNEAEIEASDILPTLIFERGSDNILINLKGSDAVSLKMLFEIFDRNKSAEQREKSVTVNIVLTVDQVLDKISSKGISSLSNEEIKILENNQ